MWVFNTLHYLALPISIYCSSIVDSQLCLFPPKHLHFLDAVTWLSMWPLHLASLAIWIISIIQVTAFSFLDCIVLPLSWHLFCFAFELLLTFSLAELKCTVHVTMSFFTFFLSHRVPPRALHLLTKCFLTHCFQGGRNIRIA